MHEPVNASSGKLPPFLCLHGLLDTLEIWNPIADALAQRSRVILVDQRGHGGSEAPPGPVRREDMASDVVAVLDECEVERAILLGHSMGGVVAMTTALRHPERIAGLVLLATASLCNQKTARWYERIALAGERDGCSGLARAIHGAGADKQVEGDARGIAQVTRMLGSLCDEPLTPELGRISCPVLLLVGEKDPMGPRASEIIREGLASEVASLEVLPGVGHWIHVDAPEATLASLDTWLANRF